MGTFMKNNTWLFFSIVARGTVAWLSEVNQLPGRMRIFRLDSKGEPSLNQVMVAGG